MNLLFDTSTQGPEKKKPRRRPTAAAVVEPAAGPVEPIRPPAPPIGLLTHTYQCADPTCGAECHDILDEYERLWSIQCCFCGTGQVVRAIPGVIAEPPAGGDFVVHGGIFDGLSIAQIAREHRGPDYIAWAAVEHPRPTVRKACETYLAGLAATR